MTSSKNTLLALFVGFILSRCSFISGYISHEVSDSFKTVNQSIDSSNHSFERINQRKSDSLRLAIEASTLYDSPQAKEILTTLNALHQKTDTLTLYIDGLLKKLNEGTADDFDLNVGTKLLVDGPDGRLLKKKLTDHISDINMLMKNYPLSSPLPMDVSPPYNDHQPKSSWEEAYFHLVPKVAVMTILDKFENDVKVTETICVRRLSVEKLNAESH